MSLMNKHPTMGGLGLPNLQAYHFTVTLDQIKHWQNSTGKTWSDMEAKMMAVPYWKSILLDPVPEPIPEPSIPPMYHSTLLENLTYRGVRTTRAHTGFYPSNLYSPPHPRCPIRYLAGSRNYLP